MERHWTETVSPEETTLSSIRILSPGCEVGDRYEILGVVGVGGSGVVYAARDRELRRNVALKVLRNDRMSESALRRFRREVTIARDVHSPHLVRVFDIAQTADTTYLTMELVEGESLARLVGRGRLSVADTLPIAAQILTALEELHRLGIVHRDIKPSNVMLTHDRRVKLTDFGLARQMESDTRATETQAIVGTYEYLSPEQALGADVDTRSDLYSFGILLYECLTGDVPHRSSSSLGTAIAHISKDAPDIRASRDDVPRWLARVVVRLLEKDRDHRYQTASEVLADLQRRHAPARRLHRAGLLFAATIAIVLGAAAFTLREIGARKFDRLVADGENGARALNRRGDVIWSDASLSPANEATEVVVTPREDPLIAVIPSSRLTPGTEPSSRLLLLEPATRKVRDTMDLPDLSRHFPDFSDSFQPAGMKSVDLDGDGAQELVVSYAHHPFWPSYSLFVDPRRKIARPLFIAAGRHSPLGTLDVDGDGRDEVIFWGVSNRLGWYSALAAVRVTDLGRGHATFAIASTPNEDYAPNVPGALVWYALVGDGFAAGTTFTIDRARRVIVAEFGDGSRTEYGADGFDLTTNRAGGDSATRSAARVRSYDALRDAQRLSRTGFGSEARRRVAEGVADADLANDAPLSAWARRVQLQIAIAHGAAPAEFEPLLAEVTKRFTAADAYWEVARALHLRGDPDLAVRWYREGLRLRATNPRGRLSWEFVEGIVFALAELERWDEAREAFERYSRTHEGVYPHYRSWIDWRATGRFTHEVDTRKHDVDESHYLALEAAASQENADVARLREAIARTRARLSEAYHWTALSLEAEMIARGGDPAGALPLARNAFDELRGRLTTEIAARAHFVIVGRRYEKIARTAGALAEADRARGAIAAFRSRHSVQ